MGLHRLGARGKNVQMSGEIWLDGKELLGADPDEVRRLRGREMAMIFQDPLSAMHPYYTVGTQIVEAYRVHHDVEQEGRPQAGRSRCSTGSASPSRHKRVDSYPHEFSGGMRQRAMIAMALVNNPELLIADEPTTALDVTVQAQILDLIRDLQKEFDSAVIMITHDLGVVAEIADDVLVMYGGRCVERGPRRAGLRRPQHPYTWGLLGSMPRIDREQTERLIPVKGQPPQPDQRPVGLRLPPALPVRGRAQGRHHPHRAARAARRSAAGHFVRLPHAAGGPRADLDRRDCAEAVSERPRRRRSAGRSGRRGGTGAAAAAERAAAQGRRAWSSTSRSRKGLLRRQVGAVQGRRRRRLRRPPGRDPRRRRRVRLRQVDHGPADHPAAGADRRQDRVRGHGHHPPGRERACGRCAATCR